MKVLVTCPPMLRRIEEFRPLFTAKGIELVTPNVVQTLTEEELLVLVPQMDAWIIGDDPATKRVFEAGKAGKLKAAVKWGVGVDNVDFKAAHELQIPISNTPQMFGNEVADVALAYITGLARQTYFIDREVRKGNWVKPAGMSLTGKTVALVGLGDIGLAIAKRLRGFDMVVNAYDPFTKLDAAAAGVDAILNFPDKLEEADFLVLACALTPSSHHWLNEDTLQYFKDELYVVNISRGALIDEPALVKALVSGKVKAAALEVFETEPLPDNSPLRSFDQCIFGTHNGSNTIEAVRRASHKAISLLFGFLNIA